MAPPLFSPADGSGPAVVLCELLLHVRQPDVLADQHDHRHEHGEQWTQSVCVPSARRGGVVAAAVAQWRLVLVCFLKMHTILMHTAL